MQCTNCRSDVADEARFCPDCGHEMSVRHDERRVVTVLFADIVGFTGLSEALDPEQVKNLVDRCFALLADDVTAFGGRVDKVIGDAIVALFGAPIAHEDDAERAVRAALSMQETVLDFDGGTGVGIRVRIGINTGEVLVGAIAAGDDYTAMGDVVNTASRLQTAAEPGSVLVGATTHAATAEVIHYHSLGRLHARGREEPVTAYQALEPVGRPGERLTVPKAPLVGREPELAVLRSSIGAAFKRNRAQLIAIVGEAGIGKSRLSRTVAEMAKREHGALVLESRCLPYGEANVWWPIAEALRRVFGIDETTSPVEATDLVRDGVETAFAPDADPTNVSRTVEGLRHLLGYGTGLSRLDAERATEEGTRAVRAAIHALSLRRPVVLWLSDVHWADEAVLQLLDELLDRLARRAVVVLVTGRVDMFDRWMPKPDRFNSVMLRLTPLDEGAVAELARELLPDAAIDVRRRLVEQSGGNPLFLEEMARMVGSSQEAEVGPLPANMRSAIASRLDALEDSALHVVEDASVLGRRGEVVALQRMAELQRNQSDITAALDALERADLIEVAGTLWSFRSNVVRDVVYSRLTKTDRAWRHAGIALWIEANKHADGGDIVAYHYRCSAALARELGGVDGMPDDLIEKAIHWTLDAARATSGATAMERTEQLYGEALELMDDGDRRKAEVLLERAGIAMGRFHTDLARRDLATVEPLLAADDEPRLRVRERLLRSELAQWSGDQDEALALGQEALGIARSLDDPVLVADGLRQVGMVRLFLGEHDEAEASINLAHSAYAEADDTGGMAWARQNLAWISYVSGRMSEAETRLGQAIETFEALGDLSATAWSRGLLAYVRIHDGRFAEAEELAERTFIEARDIGDKWGQAMMHVALAAAALWTGRVDEAIGRSHKARSLFPEGSDPFGPAQALAIEARALIRSGRVTEGLCLLTDALDAVPEHSSFQIFETSLAAAAATVGDTAIGRRPFHEVIGLDPDKLGESDRAVAGALLHLQRGDLESAGALFDVMPATAGEGSPWGWAALALVAAAVGKDPDRYVEIVESSPRATYCDRVLARCATACDAARGGDETGARVALDRAYEAVPPGGDRIHPAIVALAEAQCLAALDTDDAAAAEARAVKTASALGLDSAGWRTAFAAACGNLVTT